jgi:hypothetical protein
MVKDPKRAKSESLSLRLDPKTRFVLEFVARVEARSITTIVERAIREHADRVPVGREPSGYGNGTDERQTWTAFWDPSEGVRTLKMLSEPELRTNHDDDERHAFTMAHRQFFYDSDGDPVRAYADILWPEIDEFLEIWRTERTKNYWAAGEKMKARLSAARVAPPEWPPKSAPKKAPPPPGGGDLDDDIPF